VSVFLVGEREKKKKRKKKLSLCFKKGKPLTNLTSRPVFAGYFPMLSVKMIRPRKRSLLTSLMIPFPFSLH